MMKNPPIGTILFALEVPEWGGDTLFANQYMAFENLSLGMKKLLMSLKQFIMTHALQARRWPKLEKSDKSKNR